MWMPCLDLGVLAEWQCCLSRVELMFERLMEIGALKDAEAEINAMVKVVQEQRFAHFISF